MNLFSMVSVFIFTMALCAPCASAGLTARYFDVIAGNDMEGDVAVQLLKGTIVSGSPGSPVSGTWQSRSHHFFDLGQSE